MTTSVRPKLREVVEAIKDTSVKSKRLTIGHPKIKEHFVVLVVQRDRDGQRATVSMGLQGPVHHVRSKLVLEHVNFHYCNYHVVDWVNTRVDTFIRDLTKALLIEMQVAKLIPFNDMVV